MPWQRCRLWRSTCGRSKRAGSKTWPGRWRLCVRWSRSWARAAPRASCASWSGRCSWPVKASPRQWPTASRRASLPQDASGQELAAAWAPLRRRSAGCARTRGSCGRPLTRSPLRAGLSGLRSSRKSGAQMRSRHVSLAWRAGCRSLGTSTAAPHASRRPWPRCVPQHQQKERRPSCWQPWPLGRSSWRSSWRGLVGSQTSGPQLHASSAWRADWTHSRGRWRPCSRGSATRCSLPRHAPRPLRAGPRPRPRWRPRCETWRATCAP
mmetsp:Transcript_95622/g.298141  ORF Transcript_95622/g.298141 Transcript_95622/m.298141 type:complete len:266 (-) Transcript_95622:803-1600(-)